MDIHKAHEQATEAARVAADQKLTEMGGDFYACGFAWVTAHVDGRSKLAKELKKVGFQSAYGGGLQLWNPSGSNVQNIDIKEAGARAYAIKMRELTGEESFYMGSRLD